jgi:predicted ATP-binding protein involved in virulence
METTMRIDYLTLKNFRCFANEEFHFHPEMNVLIGQNGAGKTAILEALAVAAGSWLLGIGGFQARNIHRNDVRLKPIEIGGALTFEEQYPVSVGAEGTVDGQHIRWHRSMAGPMSRTTHGDARELRERAVRSDKGVRAGEPITLPVIAYYGSGRLWKELRDSRLKQIGDKQARLSRLEGYRDSIDDRVSPRDLMRGLEQQAWIAFQEGREPRLLRVVCNTMVGMLEGAIDVRYDPKRKDVIVVFTGAGSRPFKSLSDGQRNLLSLAGDLSMRMARLNPQLGTDVLSITPGVVLIDELDLHLHPRWQRRIVDDLRRLFPKVQFIATTHSPFIIQTLREGELMNLEGQPIPEFQNLGIETIAQGLMGVDHPEVAPRYRGMVENAKSFLQLLDEAETAPAEKLEEFKERLADKIAPFADNPAYQAILEMKRVARLGE